MARKRKKSNEQLPSRKEMELFITKNASKAKSKLSYLEKKGYYKASDTAQYHKSQIRSLNRKYGFRDDWIMTGKKFRNTIKSNADLGIMYKAFKNIIDINTKAEAIKYKEKVEEYEKHGIDFNSSFQTISYLSSEFHEIFAVLTYQQVESGLKNGEQDDAINMLRHFEEELSDKDFSKMSDAQIRNIEKIRKKMNEKLDSKELDYIFSVRRGNNYGR